MSEERINDELLMLKHFLQEEGDENWQDYCNAIQGLLDLYQKEKQKNGKIKAQIEKRISQCECEKLEATMGINDDHYQYWDCFKGILERLLQELLEERN